MDSNSFFIKKKQITRLGHLFLWHPRRNRFAFFFPSAEKKNRCSHQCLHWCQEQSTGLFHSDGFEFLLHNKKETDNPGGLSVSLAPQKEFESPTFRLGGGRSILLSYWGI